MARMILLPRATSAPVAFRPLEAIIQAGIDDCPSKPSTETFVVSLLGGWNRFVHCQMFMGHRLQFVDIVKLIHSDQVLVDLFYLQSTVNEAAVLPFAKWKFGLEVGHDLVKVLTISSNKEVIYV